MPKVKQIDELIKLVAKFKKQNKVVVMTNGCFDIIHSGHIQYLEKSKKLGDYLIVALNTNRSITKFKGYGRPINNLKDRIIVLSSIEFIDFIIPFNSNTPEKLYKLIKPNILTKGSEFNSIENIAGSKHVIKSGGKVILIDYVNNKSTSNIIKRIREV